MAYGCSEAPPGSHSRVNKSPPKMLGVPLAAPGGLEGHLAQGHALPRSTSWEGSWGAGTQRPALLPPDSEGPPWRSRTPGRFPSPSSWPRGGAASPSPHTASLPSLRQLLPPGDSLRRPCPPRPRGHPSRGGELTANHSRSSGPESPERTGSGAPPRPAPHQPPSGLVQRETRLHPVSARRAQM